METKGNKKPEDMMTERDEVRNEPHDLLGDAKKRYNNGTRKVNKLWLWLGVLILCFILLYWIFSCGLLEDLTGVTNG